MEKSRKYERFGEFVYSQRLCKNMKYDDEASSTHDVRDFVGELNSLDLLTTVHWIKAPVCQVGQRAADHPSGFMLASLLFLVENKQQQKKRRLELDVEFKLVFLQHLYSANRVKNLNPSEMPQEVLPATNHTSLIVQHHAVTLGCIFQWQ